VIGDSSEDVGEPSLGVHVIELRSHDQRGHDGSANVNANVLTPSRRGGCTKRRKSGAAKACEQVSGGSNPQCPPQPRRETATDDAHRAFAGGQHPIPSRR
jgi:hypothetical protein